MIGAMFLDAAATGAPISETWPTRLLARLFVTDLIEQYRGGALREVCTRFMGGAPECECAAAYKQASPANRITAAIPPLLLIYGVDDAQVPVETADRFVLSLGRAGLRDVTYVRLARVDIARIRWCAYPVCGRSSTSSSSAH